MKKKRIEIIGIILLCLCLAIGMPVLFYKTHFLNKTYINNINCSNLSSIDAHIKILKTLNNNNIEITEGKQKYIIPVSQLDISSDFDLKKILNKHKSGRFNINFNINIDNVSAILNSDFVRTNRIIQRNAYISYEDNKCIINKEVLGTELNLENIKNKIIKSLSNGEYIITIEESDYVKPSVLSTDKDLLSEKKAYEQYCNLNLIYKLPETEYKLTKEDLYSFLDYADCQLDDIEYTDDMDCGLDDIEYTEENLEDNEDNKDNEDKEETDNDYQYSYYIDKDKVKSFVSKFTNDNNTYKKEQTFKTSYDDLISLNGLNIGVEIDIDKETDSLYNALENLIDFNREPIYKTDNTVLEDYIEISLDNQKLFLYKNKKLLLETDIVSGNVSSGHATPTGVYYMYYKQANKTLRGPGYACPVSYWMPFNQGIGLHDATWRGSFGGNIYKTSGSHGCINLPLSSAKIIFENIDSSMPIILY